MNQYRKQIGEFNIDNNNRTIQFKNSLTQPHMESIRETYSRRIKHLNSLQDHMVKMMEFKEIQKEKKEVEREEESLMDEIEDISEMDV